MTLLQSATLFSSQKIKSWPSILPDTSILFLKKFYWSIVASLIAQLVKDPPAMQEIQVPSLGWEDPLEKEMETHSSILAWRTPWTVQFTGLQRIRLLSDFHFHSCFAMLC